MADEIDQMEGVHYCGVADQIGMDQICQWPRNPNGATRITWTLTSLLGGFTEAELVSAFTQAWRLWADVCGIEPVYVESAADAMILIKGHNLGGPGGVLADSGLPCGFVKQIQQRYDTRETWSLGATHEPGKISLVIVAAHEIGHGGIGMSHISGGNLLQPTYDPKINKPQAGDIAEAVRRYGHPVQAPAPGARKTRIVIEVDGEVKNAKVVSVN